ncbi:MAG: hypothetical protein GY847_10105 [Proteobacteria bacterium]|nr:hypothetical protein [Pseudomonadota bacterium]
MRIYIIVFGLAVMVACISSCKDEEDPIAVWGTLDCDQCQGKYEVNGSAPVLECGLNGKSFGFTVGNQKPGEDKQGYYYKVDGISGTPTVGVYSSGQNPKDGNEERGFTGAYVVNVNEWNITESDLIDDICHVFLFAEAKEGEVTPKKHGNKKFQYYVEIRCTSGFDNVKAISSDVRLTGMHAQLWFANCD